MRRPTASLILGILFVAPAPAAAAQAVGRCYPPPCAVEASAWPDPSALSATSGPTPAGTGATGTTGDRSPVPVVATGLVAVLGSLTVVGLRRRSHILRRSSTSVHTAAPAAGAPYPPERQPALR